MLVFLSACPVGIRFLQVIVVVALLVLETALVAGLLVQRRRRRRAEARLQASEQAMQLAANAAQLTMWIWDIRRDEIWSSDTLPGVAPPSGGGRRGLGSFLDRVHPDDRGAVKRAITQACLEQVEYESEYRMPQPDGSTRWYAGRGSVEFAEGAPRQMRGVTMDITRRKTAELDAQRQRNELAHMARVNVLGELSGSVAHELNQPLAAILSNAQAARMLLGRETIDLVELGAILDDIVGDNLRAAEIIRGLRRMLKKEESALERLSVNDVAREVLRLMRGELARRGVTVEERLDPAAPEVHGDRMQLQQVVLNLLLNACDAMSANPRPERVVEVGTEAAHDEVRVSVADRGRGIAPEVMSSLFKPFFTTKANGLGLGLSVCSSIVAAHGGKLRAGNNSWRGATFAFALPAVDRAGKPVDGAALIDTIRRASATAR